MTGTQTVRRTTTRARRGGSMQLLRGLGAAMLTTIIVVAVFALLMQWVKLTIEINGLPPNFFPAV